MKTIFNSATLITGTFGPINYGIMILKNLKKLKRLVIPFFIIKLVIFVVVAFKSDLVSISRDLNYTPVYTQVYDNDSIILPRLRAFQIVRNEEEGGILIRLREKKNIEPFSERKGEKTKPIID
jgi:hypothetical protein